MRKDVNGIDLKDTSPTERRTAMKSTLRFALALSTTAALVVAARGVEAAAPMQPATPAHVFETHLPPSTEGRSVTYRIPAPQSECDAAHALHPNLPRVAPCTRVVQVTIAPPVQGTGSGSPATAAPLAPHGRPPLPASFGQAITCPFAPSWYCDSGVAQECGVWGCGAFGWDNICYATWAYNYRAVWVQSFDNCRWSQAAWPYGIHIEYAGYWGNGGIAMNFGDGALVSYLEFASLNHWMRMWVWDNDSTALQTDEY